MSQEPNPPDDSTDSAEEASTEELGQEIDALMAQAQDMLTEGDPTSE